MTPEVIDGEMGKLGGTVLRRPADEVLAELEAAEYAAKAAVGEARRIVREEKKAEHKAALREKLHIG
ncbi:hypothetical protein ACWF94_30805 [Streptomyces sp. NPDC055078]